MGALAGGVGGDAVDSYRGEGQREEAECADESAGDALREAGDLVARFERRRIEDNQIGIQFVDGGLERLAESRRVLGSLAR